MPNYRALIKDNNDGTLYNAEQLAESIEQAEELLKDWYSYELDTIPENITIESITQI